MSSDHVPTRDPREAGGGGADCVEGHAAGHESEPTARLAVTEPRLSNAAVNVVYGSYHLAIRADGTTMVRDDRAPPPSVTPRVPLRLLTPDEPEPQGRAVLVARVAELLRQRTPVQLFGPPGSGRRTVARAALRRLGSEAGWATTVSGDDRGLGELAQATYAALYAAANHRPGTGELRTLVADARALVVIEDCALGSEDVDRLRQTFPECVFVLISRDRTLHSGGAALAVQPLSPDDSFRLIEPWIGQVPQAVSIAAVREGCRQAVGIPQRLLMYLAFARSVPGASAPRSIPPVEQAAMLIAGLTDPARRLLYAMANFGAAVDPACCAALAGWPDTADPGAELAAARLVVPRGGGYRPAVDALAVLAGRPEPSDAVAGAAALTALMAGVPVGEPVPSPRLLLAVARAAVAVGADAAACRLAQSSAPRLLAACEIEVWAAMIMLGAAAAGRGAEGVDATFFVHEDGVRALIMGDRRAAIAAPAAPAAAASSSRPAPPRSAADRARRVRIAAIALVVAVIVAIAVVVTITRTGSHPAPSGGHAGGASSSAATNAVTIPSASAPPSSTRPSSSQPSPPTTPRRVPDPAAVVKGYFAAINRHDYRAAWNLGGDHQGRTYEQYVTGFATTTEDVVTIVSVTGDVVLIKLAARHTDGVTLHFVGPCTVRNGVIVSASLRQTASG